MKSINHFATGVEKRRTAAALIAGAMSLAGPQAVGVALADTGSTDSSAVSSAAPGGGADATPSNPPSGRGKKAAAPRSSGRPAGTRSGSPPLTERGGDRPAGPGAASAGTGGSDSPARVKSTKISTAPTVPAPSPSASAALPQTVPTSPVDVAKTTPVTPVTPVMPVTPMTQAPPTQAVALVKPVAAPVMAAPQPVASSAAVESVLGPLLGSNPGAPVQSPASWVMLAAVRRQLGGAAATTSPAATVSTGQLVAPAAATVPAPAATVTNTPPVISSVSLGTPNATTGAVIGTVKAGDPNGDTITYRATTSAVGTLGITKTGVFTYTPTTAARHGAAKVGANTSATTATVTVTVTDSKGAATTKAVTVPSARATAFRPPRKLWAPPT